MTTSSHTMPDELADFNFYFQRHRHTTCHENSHNEQLDLS